MTEEMNGETFPLGINRTGKKRGNGPGSIVTVSPIDKPEVFLYKLRFLNKTGWDLYMNDGGYDQEALQKMGYRLGVVSRDIHSLTQKYPLG